MNPAELFRQESNTVQLAPGDFLFREGEKGETMYVLLEGEVDIFLGDFVLETAGPGALLGEMALIDDSPRTANAVAKTPAKLAQIDRRRFHFLVQQTPHFASHERRDGSAIASLERDAALLSQPRRRRYLRWMRIVAQYLLVAAIATTGC